MTTKKATQPKIARVSGAAMRAAHLFTDDAAARRFYLAGVHCQMHRGGVLLTATNGHVLARVFDEKGSWPFPPAILSFDKSALAAMKQAKGAVEPPTIEIDEPTPGKSVQTRIGGRLHEASAIDGSFPEVERVIPTGDPTPTIAPATFDGAYLQRFTNAGRELGGKGLTFHRVEIDGAQIVRLSGAPQFFGIVMPMQTRDTVRLPEWLAAKGKRLPGVPIGKQKPQAAEPAPAVKTPKQAKPIHVPPLKGAAKAIATAEMPRTRLSEAERIKRKLERRGYRQRVRAILGRGVRLSSLTEKQREEVKAKAREPLQRMSLAAIAKAGAKITSPVTPTVKPKPAPALVFEAKHRADLLAGRKVTTIRKASPHTARFTVGLRVPVESPKGDTIGETTIRKVEAKPVLTASERKGASRLYGTKAALVRITFDRVKAAAKKPARR